MRATAARCTDVAHSHAPAGCARCPDNDAFANSGWLSEHLRGRNWRGTDCNDGDGAIYPGRRVPAKSNADVDHNCNSIKGKNSLSGMGLEQQFCNVSQRGIIILGDSATAHFHIPPAWCAPPPCAAWPPGHSCARPRANPAG